MRPRRPPRRPTLAQPPSGNQVHDPTHTAEPLAGYNAGQNWLETGATILLHTRHRGGGYLLPVKFC